MGGALARGLLRRVKPPTGVWSCREPDSNRNLSLILVSHPRGAVQFIWGDKIGVFGDTGIWSETWSYQSEYPHAAPAKACRETAGCLPDDWMQPQAPVSAARRR